MKKQEFMRKTYTLTIIACLQVLVFGGCHHTPSQKAMMLQRADSLMEEHPDSSLTILEKITAPEKLSQGDYALWCLLITQARDKNYITHTSDSLINIAVNYFSKKGDPSRMAQSYYVQGRVENDLESYEKALTAYLNARRYVQQTGHDRLNARINNHLGSLYWAQGFYLKSKICYEQALSSFVKGNDTTGTVNALRNIGDSFYALEQNDSALFYLNKAYLLANEGNVNSQKAYVFAYLGNIYEALGDFQRALYYNLQSLDYPYDKNFKYSRFYAIAELYDELQRPDSAFFYAKKALESPDIYHRCGMNRFLYHLYFKQHEYDKAYFHNKQYDLLKDSIHSESQSVKLAKVEALYNKDRLVYEKQQQKQEDEIKILALLFLVVVIGIVFLWIYQHIRRKNREYKEKVDRVMQQLTCTNTLLTAKKKEIAAKDITLKGIQQQFDSIMKSIESSNESENGASESDTQNINNMELEINRLATKIENLINEKDALIKDKERILNAQNEQLESLSKKKETYQMQFDSLKNEYDIFKDEQKSWQQEKEEAGKAREEVLKNTLNSLEEKNRQLEVYALWFKSAIEENDCLNNTIRKQHLSKWEEVQWKEFMNNFNKVFHLFSDRLNCLNSLTEREVRICCLVKLGLKTNKIAEIFELENDTISRIKGEIRNKCFPNEKKCSLDKILAMWY